MDLVQLVLEFQMIVPVKIDVQELEISGRYDETLTDDVLHSIFSEIIQGACFMYLIKKSRENTHLQEIKPPYAEDDELFHHAMKGEIFIVIFKDIQGAIAAASKHYVETNSKVPYRFKKLVINVQELLSSNDELSFPYFAVIFLHDLQGVLCWVKHSSDAI